MKTKASYLLFLLALTLGCSKAFVSETTQYEIEKQFSVTGEIILGEKLNNPYSLNNMKEAWKQLNGTKSGEYGNEPEANWLYVRFLPKDSTEFMAIENLNLFCYPLDYQILQYGEYYHDPDLDEDQITWQYTRVTPDYEFPDIEYEILDECFVPEYEAGTKAGASLAELEALAIELSGNTSDGSIDTKATSGSRPSGNVTVYNDSNNQYVPVVGVKVQCNYFLKIGDAWTNGNGDYSMSTSFPKNPDYSLVFENKEGFTQWNGIAVLGPAKASYGKSSAKGRRFEIKKTSNTVNKEWVWATVNNNVHNYYAYARQSNSPVYDNNLKIMTFTPKNYGAMAGCAPMLRRVNSVSLNTNSEFGNIMANIALVPTSYALMFIFKLALPDIILTIDPANWMTYDLISSLVFHEMSHTSHFAVAGTRLWSEICSAIMSNGFDYGNKGSKTSGLIDLEESWAFGHQYYGTRYWQNDPITITMLTGGHWKNGDPLNKDLFYEIMQSNTLTPREIVTCMTSDIKSIEQLKTKLVNKYPSKKAQIEEKFKKFYIK